MGREDSVDSTVHVYYGELCLFDEAFHSTDRRIAKSATMNAVLFVLLFNYLPLYGYKIAFQKFVPVKRCS